MSQFLRARDVVDVANNLKRIPLVNDPFQDITVASDILEIDSNENDNVDWFSRGSLPANHRAYTVIRDNISNRITAIVKNKNTDEEINDDI